MTSWLPEWTYTLPSLPSLPSLGIALPSSIQRRFVSFVLRRSLGRFLKPGQLDDAQVDSQIGSGFVQINDLELDHAAINAMLAGLPVELQEGAIASVIARVPWPNPLTSTLGLSLQSLHLTLRMTSPQQASAPTAAADLAESVASLADSFMHDELDRREEADLIQSLHPQRPRPPPSEEIPGGLDPFMADDDDSDTPQADEVSIFSSMVEHLLARFEFDAVDTKITLIKPEVASYTLHVPSIRYGAQRNSDSSKKPRADETSQTDKPVSHPYADRRAVTISGVTITTHSLRKPLTRLPTSPGIVTPTSAVSPVTSPSTSPSIGRPRPIHVDPTSPTASASSSIMTSSLTLSRTSSIPEIDILSQSHAQLDAPSPSSPTPSITSSHGSHALALSQSIAQFGEPTPSPPSPSDSDMDEQAQLYMSQSIVGLPPRPASPTSSMASSMYQSAVSFRRHDSGSSNDDAGLSLTHAARRTPSPSRSVSTDKSEPMEPPADIPTTPNLSAPHLEMAPEAEPRTSNSPTQSEDRQAATEPPAKEDVIFSMASERIIIVLVSPWAASKETHANVGAASPTAGISSPPPSAPIGQERPKKSGRVEVTMGIAAIALRAPHIRDLLEIANTLPSSPAKPSGGTTRVPDNNQPSNEIAVTARIRGIVLLLLPSQDDVSQRTDGLEAFFAHALVPPRLSRGYIRVHVDNISTTFSTTKAMQSTVPSTRGDRIASRNVHEMMTRVLLTVADISIFSFRLLPSKATRHTILHAFPIFITDPNLPSQYSSTHAQPTAPTQGQPMHGVPSTQLPSFDVTDWTNPEYAQESAKLSAWRVRPPPPVQQRSSGFGIANIGLSTSPPTRSSPLSALSRLQGDGQEASAIKVVVEGKEITMDCSVAIAPVHVFADLGALLEDTGSDKPCGSEVLAFIEECTGMGSGPSLVLRDEDVSSPERTATPKIQTDTPTSHSTPRAHIINLPGQETQKPKERQRLERLVLEDLNLHSGTAESSRRRPTRQGSVDEAGRFTVNIRLPLIRAQIRSTPPTGRDARSGALVVDLHELTLRNTPPVRSHQPSQARFTPTHAEDTDQFREIDVTASRGETLLHAQWSCILVSHSLVGERRAHGVLSLGPTSVSQTLRSPTSPTLAARLQTPELPYATITRMALNGQHGTTQPKTVVSVGIPGVFITLTKAIVDGLQLWADDTTQLAGRTLGASSTNTTPRASRNPSLIGSRFFARQGMHGSRSTTESEAETVQMESQSQGETVIKLVSSEVFLRVMLPRHTEHAPVLRPLDVVALNIDGLIELKPDGKDETVVTLAIMDVALRDTMQTGLATTYLSLTAPRDFDSTPKPMVKLRLVSLIVPGTIAKESRVKATITGISYCLYPDLAWTNDLSSFLKAPPGAFESVVPSERTKVVVKLLDSSIQVVGAPQSASLAVYIEETEFSADLVGDSPETSALVDISSATVLLTDETDQDVEGVAFVSTQRVMPQNGVHRWKSKGFAVLAELSDLSAALQFIKQPNQVDTRVAIEHAALAIHLCADTATAIAKLAKDMSPPKKEAKEEQKTSVSKTRHATLVSPHLSHSRNLLASLDENAFRRQVPEVGSIPDMMEDDVPTNPDYLDDSFGRIPNTYQPEDDESDDFNVYDAQSITIGQDGIISLVGGETIKMLQPEGLRIVEHHFNTIVPDSIGTNQQLGQTEVRVRVHDCDVSLLLHDGYDWPRIRRTIEEEKRTMRRRLAKIKQMLANGQTYDPSVEDTSALLFNSVYVGLEEDATMLEPDALAAVIDTALDSDDDLPTESSWQSLPPQHAGVPPPTRKLKDSSKSRRLNRSRGPAIEFRLSGLHAEFDKYRADEPYASRTLVTVRDLEILDHIKTSTWKMFLTEMRADLRGNVRETGSNMVRLELRNVRPVPGDSTEEVRLKMKILPLRLHVDQDALDFLKQFFGFKDSSTDSPAPTETTSSDETYFQHVEVFPIDLKLDYKPRRVDYRALRDGKTIELMNFFHFDGSEMTLRHITLHGLTGWARLGDTLNDLWTPDVKATQLMDVISGVAPIRSVVNVGSGVADLVLLPIAQYRKDGRILRGVQKGTTAFMKSTGMEALRLGAQLATGTQVILEQAESVLGAQFKDAVTAETLQFNTEAGLFDEDVTLHDDATDHELISRYAEQPMDVKEGIQSAVKSLRRNLNSAAQTILAVPMEVYERSGTEGPVRAVIRAVPIAVLKPMIGATEAVSKTLQGIHNTFDPDVRQQNEVKYKHRV